MKLPDFTHDQALKALRDAMGATQQGNFTTTYRPSGLSVAELEQLSNQGIDISIDEIVRLNDGTLGYKDSRVLLYIRDVSFYGGKFDLPRFHFAYCRKLREMKADNRFDKYVVATRDNGTFLVNKIDRGRKVGSFWPELRVCQFCLDSICFDSFSFSLDTHERKRIVNNFTIGRFFELYPKSLHLARPKYDYITSPVNEYPPGFSEDSTRYRTDKDWTCERCGISFIKRSERKFLHTHHLNGLKYQNDAENYKALCIGCHAEQPQHAHMKRMNTYREFLRRYGARWKAALKARGKEL